MQLDSARYQHDEKSQVPCLIRTLREGVKDEHNIEHNIQPPDILEMFTPTSTV